jgi:hypothetical protein
MFLASSPLKKSRRIQVDVLGAGLSFENAGESADSSRLLEGKPVPMTPIWGGATCSRGCYESAPRFATRQTCRRSLQDDCRRVLRL